MQIHAEHNDSINKDVWLSLLEKYVPLNLFARVGVCERELETEQNCNILTPPTLISTSLGVLNRDGDEAHSAACCSLYCILSLTHLISNSLGGPEGPFCWAVAFSTTSCL